MSPQLNAIDPTPIFCRGHSGGRLLCEALIRSGVDMGVVHPVRKDTSYFSAENHDMRKLLFEGFNYDFMPAHRKEDCNRELRRLVAEFHTNEVSPSAPRFGWKLGITIFILPIFLQAFPNARCIHLIRDGRDVMMSRLSARMDNFQDPLNKLLTFGRTDVDEFQGYPLNEKTVALYRNTLEMLHWKLAVGFGLKGRSYADRCLEVKYENVCESPLREFQKIFDFLELPFRDATKDWLTESVRTDRIGKWRGLSTEELKLPLEIGGSLLDELGYQ